VRLSTIWLIATLALVIGRLSPGSPCLVAHLWEVFRQGLHELGYVAGQNLVIEARYAEGRPDRSRQIRLPDRRGDGGESPGTPTRPVNA